MVWYAVSSNLVIYKSRLSWAMDSNSSSTSIPTFASASASASGVPNTRSGRIRIGVSLLQGRWGRSSTSSSSSSAPSTQSDSANMPIHVIHLGGAPYVTTSHVLAADFHTWAHRVDTYPHSHHNVLALLDIQRAEGYDQTAREAELMDVWCAEWVGRWGFEARVGAMLSEQEDRGGNAEERGMWDFGGAVGMGRNSFTEEVRAVKVGRGRRWVFGLRGVRAWFGGGVGRRNGSLVGEVAHVDGDMLPPYTKGEDPPAYEQ